MTTDESDASPRTTTGRPRAFRSTRAKLIVAAAVLGGLLALYGLLSWTGALATITDAGALRQHIVQSGWLGPAAIVGLLAVAIILNPIPSAPIALAAGAVYGHYWGTVYVVIGAESGALLAFAIARIVGYEVVRRWFGDRLSLGTLASQNALMAVVFLSRLLPFISFDIVSYAAGLTPLATWRFAVATLAGIVPTSFALAHFGGEMTSGNTRQITIAVVALGGLTLLPLVAKLLWNRYQKRRGESDS